MNVTARPELEPRTTYRVTALDALRGFALCGILLVNIPQITHMARTSLAGGMPQEYPIPLGLDLLVQNHFFPIFSFLFGLSFAIFLEGAVPRSPYPRLLLVRRLVALGVLGLAHQQLHPGEALLPYAIVGLLVLVPASWLPVWTVLPAGLLLLVVSVTLGSGGIASIPGLFLLGLAVARLGVARTLDRRTGQLTVLLSLAVPAAFAAGWWQLSYPLDGPLATRIAAASGLVGALAYATAVLLLLRTPPGRAAATAVLEPLGRMALTNYVTATLVVVAAAMPLGLDHSTRWPAAMALAVAILAAQTLAGRWGLARYRYGPLEWCLRSVTWWGPVPQRRAVSPG